MLGLKAARVAKGLTQHQLSVATDTAVTMISRLESERCGCHINTAVKFAKILGVPIEYLVFGESAVVDDE